MSFLTQALEYLRDKKIENPLQEKEILPQKSFSGCPGSKEINISENEIEEHEFGSRVSHLKQWPIQLHLVSPQAAYYRNSDLLLTADCCGFAYADFHKDFLKGKSIAIACPKLDTNKQVYLEKLISMINDAQIKSITVMVMEVPCCNGLTQLALQATEFSERKIIVNVVVLGINGKIVKEGSFS